MCQRKTTIVFLIGFIICVITSSIYLDKYRKTKNINNKKKYRNIAIILTSLGGVFALVSLYTCWSSKTQENKQVLSEFHFY